MAKTGPKHTSQKGMEPEREGTATAKGRRVCSSEKEFEELFLPGTHEKKTIEETVQEPGKLKESLLKKMRK